MIFTREDILKILNALVLLGRRDSEFKDANIPLNNDDYIAIIQDGINKKVSINNLLSTLGLLKKDDFINVSDRYDEYYIQLSEAITIIANNKRKKGLVITFQDLKGDWKIYQFTGEVSNFINTELWKDLFDFKYPIVNSVLPDEEDLTLTYPNREGNSFIQLKDKEYDPENFSGMATKILRKRIVEVNDPELGKVKKNVLYQDDFNQKNCIYEIRYDFDLNGETITIPEGCTFKFEGGSFSNGTIEFNGTFVQGISKIFGEGLELSGTLSNLVSPIMFGSLEDPDSAYLVIFRTYLEAAKASTSVIWSGISNISMNIPEGAQSIPLILGENNFGWVSITVLNTVGNFTLFSMVDDSWKTLESFDKSLLDGYDYSSIQEILDGIYLLYVEDQTYWTKRIGYNYSHIRKDMIVVKYGTALNLPIYSYSSDSSAPVVKYKKISEGGVSIRNLLLVRSNLSTYRTSLANCSGINNLLVDSVSINTEEGTSLTNDRCLIISDSTNVTISNVCFRNSYDDSGFGYGINLENIYRLSICNMKAIAKNWGIFGNNNLNEVHVINCSLNRFDVHQYCKNLYFIDCTFYDIYVLASSIFGKYSFTNCTFNNMTPIVYDSSFNTYTKHLLIFDNCVINKLKYPFIISLYGFVNETNSRPELLEKYIPEVLIRNCKIETTTLLVYLFGSTSLLSIVSEINVGDITIDGLLLSDPSATTFGLFYRTKVTSSRTPSIRMNNFDMLQTDDLDITLSTKYNYRKTILLNNLISPLRLKLYIRNSRFGMFIPTLEVNYDIDAYNCTIIDMRYVNLERIARFEDCNIYLTCIDEDKFDTLESAEYIGCKFISLRGFLAYLYLSGKYVFKNCEKTTDEAFIRDGIAGDEELKDLTVYKDLGRIGVYIYLGGGYISNAPLLNSSYRGTYYDIKSLTIYFWNGTKWIDSTALWTTIE